MQVITVREVTLLICLLFVSKIVSIPQDDASTDSIVIITTVTPPMVTSDKTDETTGIAITTSATQTTTEDHKHVVTGNAFITPNQVSESADSFIFNSMEYIFVSGKVDYNLATTMCKFVYNATLSIVNDMGTATFLGEALSETNLDLNSLWIGATQKPGSTEFEWENVNDPIPFNKTLFNKLICSNPGLPTTNNTHHCLAFARSFHLQPQFRALNCRAQRSYICQRKASYIPGKGGSTHTGWIKIGNKGFKIFYAKASWDKAAVLCTEYDANSTLAVISNLKEVRLLGRFLLIGRPSLENAWIGARWNKEKVLEYIGGESTLPLVTEKNNFPPWKDGRVSKYSGCVLLDRHVENRTIFLEARCERYRPYICYKEISTTNITITIDIIIGPYGYRVIQDEKPWQQAYDFCFDKYNKKYGGKLAQTRNETEIFNLLHVMGENRTELQHIWLAGKYADQKWVWKPENDTITGKTFRLIQNSTYLPEVEKMNECLNMDRENHMTAFHYGTDCRWPQRFVCSFEAAQLIKLQEDEKKAEMINELEFNELTT